jgi:hypothetical protein
VAEHHNRADAKDSCRNLLFSVLFAITGVTLLAVWPSISDPWGWYLEGANALFFPSLVIFAGALVLMGFREFDVYSLDARNSARQAESSRFAGLESRFSKPAPTTTAPSRPQGWPFVRVQYKIEVWTFL